MKKATQNWIESSDYDIKTAEAMFKSKRYLYVVFMCHLATEKMLKALVSEKQSDLPPKTHDLLYLVRMANVTIPEQHQGIITLLNTASVPTRYPEDLRAIAKEYNAPKVKFYLTQTKEVSQWLRKLPPLKE